MEPALLNVDSMHEQWPPIFEMGHMGYYDLDAGLGHHDFISNFDGPLLGEFTTGYHTQERAKSGLASGIAGGGSLFLFSEPFSMVLPNEATSNPIWSDHSALPAASNSECDGGGFSKANASSPKLISAPRVQCWEHDCQGRYFSTMSNLLRHQREKSGMAEKWPCHICGKRFTRSTAVKKHKREQHEHETSSIG